MAASALRVPIFPPKPRMERREIAFTASTAAVSSASHCWFGLLPTPQHQGMPEHHHAVRGP